MVTYKSKILLVLILFTSVMTVALSALGTTENKSIDTDTIASLIRNQDVTVLAFHSSSCGTCKVQKPRLQSLMLKEQNAKIADVFLDFDTAKDLREKHKVSFPSTILVFKKGIEVARVTGETDERKLQELLNRGIL